MNVVLTPGANAEQAVAYHNHEAERAHHKALIALNDYNAAVLRLQAALSAMDAQRAAQAEAEADAAWTEMLALLTHGYEHRNTAAMAAEIEQNRKDGQ
ncbi:MAG: hypothetical protein H7Y60_16870 [Rhodospirillaceae bacterium]|nr:hypothetical protein [Rhodospirillales bacterium]